MFLIIHKPFRKVNHFSAQLFYHSFPQPYLFKKVTPPQSYFSLVKSEVRAPYLSSNASSPGIGSPDSKLSAAPPPVEISE